MSSPAPSGDSGRRQDLCSLPLQSNESITCPDRQWSLKWYFQSLNALHISNAPNSWGDMDSCTNCLYMLSYEFLSRTMPQGVFLSRYSIVQSVDVVFFFFWDRIQCLCYTFGRIRSLLERILVPETDTISSTPPKSKREKGFLLFQSILLRRFNASTPPRWLILTNAFIGASKQREH